jgi:hypothetical protein
MPQELKKEWDAFLERKKISQQDALVAMIRYAMVQNDVFQSIMMGQMKADHDLLITILRREAKDKQ